jgi:formyl-CoA transferase
MKLPLQGVRILAVEQLMALPFGTQILADLGAEIVAVESVGYANDDNVPWRERTGRHKRRIQVRLNDPRGQDILRRLAMQFDVFGENFRPGIMDKYRLGYSDLSQLNERLVYVSVSGFGHKDFLESPYSPLASYGNIGEAIGGTLHAVRAVGGEHTGVASGDITTTLFAMIGVLAALRHRDLTGKGQYIDVAMADSLFSMAELPFFRYMLECESRETHSEAPRGVSYPYGTFAAADGEYTMMVLSDAHWQSFCKLLGHEEWLSDREIVEPLTRGSAVSTRVLPVLREWSRSLTRAEVVQLFRAAGLAAAPVNAPKDIVADPHFTARRMIETIIRANGKPIQVAGNPIKMSTQEAARTENPVRTVIERPGQSTCAVLRQELGISNDDLEALRREGVIAWPPA